MSPAKTYLLTGTNRGIGLGLSALILVRPHTILVALVKDPNAQSLLSLPIAENSHLIIVQYHASDPSSAANTIENLIQKHGIQAIDIAISNAGGVWYSGPSKDASAQDRAYNLQVNTFAGVPTAFQGDAASDESGVGLESAARSADAGFRSNIECDWEHRIDAPGEPCASDAIWNVQSSLELDMLFGNSLQSIRK